MRVRLAVATVAIAGAIAGAIAWTRAARDVDPEDEPREEPSRDDEARALEARGRAALDAGRNAEALAHLAAAYEIANRASVRFLLARAFGAHGERGTIADAGAPISLSPDGALLAVAHDRELVVWTTAPPRRTGQLALTSQAVALAWNPKDPRQLVVAGAAGAQFYDVTRGRASVIDGVPGQIAQLAWGTRVRAAIEQHGAFALSDLSPPRETLALAGRPLAVNADHALVCGGDACELVGAHGEIEIPIAARLAVFGDDRLAIASATEVVVVDLLGRELARIDGAVTAIALAGDGTRIVTSTSDATRISDAETGEVLETIPQPLRAMSRDGTWLVTGESRLWHLPLEARTPAEVRALVK